MSCWVLLKENIPTVDCLVCGPTVFRRVRCVHRKWSIDLTPGHYLIFSTILFFWAKPRLPGRVAARCNSIFHDQFTTGSSRPRYPPLTGYLVASLSHMCSTILIAVSRTKANRKQNAVLARYCQSGLMSTETRVNVVDDPGLDTAAVYDWPITR